MDASLNHGGAPQFPATESDLDPEMVAIAGAIIRQRIGKFEYPLFEVYLSANHRGARILRRPWASLLTPSNLTLDKSLGAGRQHFPSVARARARARGGSENQRPWPADKVERWSIDRLIPYAKNARTHSGKSANTSPP